MSGNGRAATHARQARAADVHFLADVWRASGGRVADVWRTSGGRVADQLQVAWSGMVPQTADELFAARAAAATDERDGAIDFLNDVLAAGPLPREQVVRQAESEGISLRTLERACEKMHLVSEPDPANARYRTWRLPSDEDVPRILRELWGEEQAAGGSGQEAGSTTAEAEGQPRMVE